MECGLYSQNLDYLRLLYGTEQSEDTTDQLNCSCLHAPAGQSVRCPMAVFFGVYIQWNGIAEWNSGMDYWNDGMLHRTYLIIQHVLYSEQ